MARNVVPRSDGDGSVGTSVKQWNTIYAHSFSGGLKTAFDTKASNEELARVEGLIAYASAPNYYERDKAFYQSGQTKIKSPNELWLNINNKGHKLTTAVEMDISSHAVWDTNATEWAPSTAYEEGQYVYHGDTGYIYKCTTAGISSSLEPTFPETVGDTYNDGSVVWTCCVDYTAAANRVGRDFYIYAIYSSTLIPGLVISVNSTVPEGYTATNSRKVGGFHCLCADVGTIADHPLSEYVAGDILPASVWDLKHRPKSEPEGMVYIEGINLWVDIYLASWTGSYSNEPEDLKLVSVYGGTVADGTSEEKFHCYKFEQLYGRQNKRLLYQREFVCASIGSNQSTNILSSADPGTTGGHKNTANRRMVSNFGVEDCCGALYQWGADVGAGYTGSSWVNGFDANDKYVGGQNYGSAPFRPLLGGAWNSGAACGSRCVYWAYGALSLSVSCAGRGASEPS